MPTIPARDAHITLLSWLEGRRHDLPDDAYVQLMNSVALIYIGDQLGRIAAALGSRFPSSEESFDDDD